MDNKLMSISKGELENFSEYRVAGDIAANKVFNVLRAQSKNKQFTISRVKIGGSIGKRTSLGTDFQPDFDLLVFVDNEEPPFDDLLEDFEEILERNYDGTGVYIYEKTTKYSLQFKLKVTDPYSDYKGTYISFDLLPAVNFLSPENQMLPSDQKDRIQVERTLREISCLEDPEEDWNMYASSLGELSISFVANQNDFTHDVIRLAKLWNKKVDCQGMVYGRSTMIEHVAIYSAMAEEEDADENDRQCSISNAFRIFLNKFCNFDTNMWVAFSYPTNPNQSGPYEMYLKQEKCRPLVLDYSNPYNNLAENVSYRAKWAFGNHARHTLNFLNSNWMQFDRIDSCFGD